MTKKQRKNLYNIIICAFLLIICVILPLYDFLKYIFLLGIYIFIGQDVLKKALRNLKNIKNLDENFLMAIATIGAICIGELFEAVFIMLFYKTGELFESIAVGKSRKSISRLMDLNPEYANILKDGKIIKVSPESVKKGDILIVSAGEKISLDGVIVKGSASLNTMALTGESMPVFVEVGSNVMSGSINIDGVIEIRVEKEFYDSTVNKILELVENSASNKSKSETFITKFSKYYTPSVVICAFLMASVCPLITGGFLMWLKRAFIFLVVSCPCALVISVPLSFFAGIGKASKNGILIKGANYLEALSNVSAVVFDKTGTLTYGDFFVSKIYPENMSCDSLLSLVAKCEYFSNHPISASIKREYNKEIDKNEITDASEVAGLGMSAVVNGKKVLAGNKKLLLKSGINVPEINSEGTVVYVGCDGKYEGYIEISDKIKNDASDTIQGIKKLGISKTVILTGDKKEVAEKIGNELGIDEIHSELLPNEKVKRLEAIMNKHNKVIFVGDGINDAPVLMRADIGISMGGIGSDAAIEASDIVLMDDKLSKIGIAVEISKKTKRIVLENIVFSLFIKFAVLILGATGYADMMMASFADVGVSVIAILNAMRLLF